mmetsp:Transcript_36012/g.95603  ORF Transcript_36012/g.95603 Transcript_36012/m.95603 type:complete len:407 (-) Transcript_36012:170-1390(-)
MYVLPQPATRAATMPGTFGSPWAPHPAQGFLTGCCPPVQPVTVPPMRVAGVGPSQPTSWTTTPNQFPPAIRKPSPSPGLGGRRQQASGLDEVSTPVRSGETPLRTPLETEAQWDPEAFKSRFEAAHAQGDVQEMRSLLKGVSSSNYKLTKSCLAQQIPRTELVTLQQVKQFQPARCSNTQFSITSRQTGDALLDFAHISKCWGGVVCGLNFANGVNVGGGYVRGAMAQEEELCRQFPTLYTSLKRAKEHCNAYPFGPSTYRGGDIQRYADVLFTGRIAGCRANRAQGYRTLAEHEFVDNIALVSAAAPNVKQGESNEARLVQEAITAIMIAPKMMDPRIDTLVLGAWGCGAFGCDAHAMAQHFATALNQRLGEFYREVVFAIPDTDQNAQIFERTLRAAGVPLVRK